MIKTGAKLGTEILEALNLPTKGVSQVSINCKPGEVATVSITLAVDENGEFADVLRKYKIVEAD